LPGGTNEAIPDSATITENTASTTQTDSNTIILPPSDLNLDQENVGNVAVRFTAPTAGIYTFTGSFSAPTSMSSLTR
jgi:hypothetical protein